MYRHQHKLVTTYRQELLSAFEIPDLPRLHWLDNFAKSYASNDMFIHRDLLLNRYWTAHGFKTVPVKHNLSWVSTADGSAIPAMPLLDVFLSDSLHDGLMGDLALFHRLLYSDSVVVTRDVRRVPLKVTAASNAKEAKHLSLSSDGLRYFYPVKVVY